MLEIHSIPVGPIQANCHILRDSETGRMVVVDPGDDAEEIAKYLKRLGGTVEAIWNTHGHIDHINGNAGVKAANGAPISIHESVAQALESPILSGASWTGIPFNPSKADHTWKGGEILDALGREWSVRHAPGHSLGCCLITCEGEKLMVGGDVLFAGSIGRTDLPGGNPAVMTETLRMLFSGWAKDEWTVLPGHGDSTTIGAERRSNPYVREALGPGLSAR
ncbi:MBL fold metallo-hydrolase [soil metagenome]